MYLFLCSISSINCFLFLSAAWVPRPQTSSLFSWITSMDTLPPPSRWYSLLLLKWLSEFLGWWYYFLPCLWTLRTKKFNLSFKAHTVWILQNCSGFFCFFLDPHLRPPSSLRKTYVMSFSKNSIYLFMVVLGLHCCIPLCLVASGGYSSLRCVGFSGVVSLVRGTGRGQTVRASVVVGHKLSCSMPCGIFLDQDLSLCPLHWQVDSYPRHHHGSPVMPLSFSIFFLRWLKNFFLN